LRNFYSDCHLPVFVEQVKIDDSPEIKYNQVGVKNIGSYKLKKK